MANLAVENMGGLGVIQTSNQFALHAETSRHTVMHDYAMQMSRIEINF